MTSIYKTCMNLLYSARTGQTFLLKLSLKLHFFQLPTYCIQEYHTVISYTHNSTYYIQWHHREICQIAMLSILYLVTLLGNPIYARLQIQILYSVISYACLQHCKTSHATFTDIIVFLRTQYSVTSLGNSLCMMQKLGTNEQYIKSQHRNKNRYYIA